MIYIKDLKEIPYSCEQLRQGELWKCPCYNSADADGPEYCSVLVMITGSYLNAHPSKETCPFRKEQKTESNSNNFMQIIK